MPLANSLELEDIELVALLGVVDTLNKTTVPLLEGVGLVYALLFEASGFNLLFSQLNCSFSLLTLFRCIFIKEFGVSLLSGLDRSD